MNNSIIFVIATLLTGYFALAIRNSTLKAIFYSSFVVCFIFMWQQTLGVPLPQDLNVFHQKGKVIAQSFDEPNAIYVWMLPEHSRTPIYVQLPWEMQIAQRLREAEKNHEKMKVELPSLKEKIVDKLKSAIKGKEDKSGKKSESDKQPTDGSEGDKDKSKSDGKKEGNSNTDVVASPNAPKAEVEKSDKPDPTKSSTDQASRSISGAVFYPEMHLDQLPTKEAINPEERN